MNNIDELPWNDYDNMKRKEKELLKARSTVISMITDAKANYVKKKVGARRKRDAADPEKMFEELNDYSSERDIDDAYGWEFITENERDRLQAMWQAREEYKANSGKISDPVTEMFDTAINAVYERDSKFFELIGKMDKARKESQMRIQEANEEAARQAYLRSIGEG